MTTRVIVAAGASLAALGLSYYFLQSNEDDQKSKEVERGGGGLGVNISQQRGRAGHELRRKSLESLAPANRALVIMSADQTLDTGLLILSEHGLLAVPVADLETRSYLGLLSTLSVVVSMSQHVEDGKAKNLPDEPVRALTLDKIVVHPATGRLEEVLPYFFDGVHRVFLTVDGNIRSLISATDLVRHLHATLRSLHSPLLECSLEELGFLSDREFERIHANDRVIDKLTLLSKHGVLAIVDDEGEFVGDLSTEDIRRFSRHNMDRLSLTVAEFGITRDFLETKRTTLLSEVMENLLSRRKHRVWILDDAGRPVACVTMLSILKHLIQ